MMLLWLPGLWVLMMARAKRSGRRVSLHSRYLLSIILLLLYSSIWSMHSHHQLWWWPSLGIGCGQASPLLVVGKMRRRRGRAIPARLQCIPYPALALSCINLLLAVIHGSISTRISLVLSRVFAAVQGCMYCMCVNERVVE